MSNKIYKIAEEIFFSAAIFRLSKGEKDIKLSNKEAELLEMLCDEAGSVIPRNILQEALWPNQDNTDTNLNRQILSLRRKLESFGLLNSIDTIPRVGYIFCAPIEVALLTKSEPRGLSPSGLCRSVDLLPDWHSKPRHFVHRLHPCK
ncbi:winged helix-turn-helix domain-containing protein, partial [Aeromonas bestiarum]